MGSVARDGFEGKVSAPESHLSGKDKAYMWVQPQSPLQSHPDGISLGEQLFVHPWLLYTELLKASSTDTIMSYFIRSWTQYRTFYSKRPESLLNSQAVGTCHIFKAKSVKTFHLIFNPQSRVQSKASPNITTQHKAGWLSMCPCLPQSHSDDFAKAHAFKKPNYSGWRDGSVSKSCAALPDDRFKPQHPHSSSHRTPGDLSLSHQCT